MREKIGKMEQRQNEFRKRDGEKRVEKEEIDPETQLERNERKSGRRRDKEGETWRMDGSNIPWMEEVYLDKYIYRRRE